MRDLVSLSRRPEPPPRDPASLWYRRAAGLEVRARPEETWSEVQLGRSDQAAGGGAAGRGLSRFDLRLASTILGLTRWVHASELEARHGVSPAELWRLVDRDLLVFSPSEERASLTGRSGVLREGGPLTRRGSMWPTVAVETAIQIAPMPFMPRGDDLRGAELAGVRFASLERGFEVLGVTITGSKRIGELFSRLLPLLDGTRTLPQLVEVLPTSLREDAVKLLELLDACTVLEPASAELAEDRRRFTATSEPQVCWLGHAAVLIQAEGKRVLVDPLFFSRSEPEERWVWPRKPDPRALPPLDAVFITHGDNDHLNANSLAVLPRETPIYIPRISAFPPPHQVDLRGVLRVLGFRAVYELETWGATAIGELLVTACPFEGESWGLELAQCTYLFEGENASIFLGADSHRMDAVYERLGRERRRVDLALLGVSGSAEPHVTPEGLGYGSFYREWIPRARHNEWVHHCSGPEDAVHNAALLRPRFVFGYASGGATYIRTEYSDTGDHETLAELLAAASGADPALAGVAPVALPLGEPVPIASLAGLPPKAECPWKSRRSR